MAAVVQQPLPQEYLSEWRFGLYDIFRSTGDCLGAFACSPCYAAIASDAAGESCFCSAFQCCCYPFGLIYLRARVRKLLGIHGGILNDCWAAICCGPCTAVQIKRESTE